MIKLNGLTVFFLQNQSHTWAWESACSCSGSLCEGWTWTCSWSLSSQWMCQYHFGQEILDIRKRTVTITNSSGKCLSVRIKTYQAQSWACGWWWWEGAARYIWPTAAAPCLPVWWYGGCPECWRPLQPCQHHTVWPLEAKHLVRNLNTQRKWTDATQLFVKRGNDESFNNLSFQRLFY